MATYSSIDFSVALDNSGGSPLIKLNDISTYAGADAEDATGYFEVTQPDGNTIAIGSFGTPSVEWNVSELTQAQGVLRLATNSQFQNGTYSITYYQRVTGYDDNSVTKQFTLSYTRPTAVISPSLNVFTPQIKTTDTTDYAQTGLTVNSKSWDWEATVSEGVGTITGPNAAVFDIDNSSVYYDAEYAVTLAVIVSYTIAAATWVTLLDKVLGSGTYDVYAPPTLATLLSELTELYEELTTSGSSCSCEGVSRSKYTYSWTLYQHFKARGDANDVAGLYTMLDDLKTMLGIVDASHSGDPLTPYSF
jgi:hypothetical protein